MDPATVRAAHLAREIESKRVEARSDVARYCELVLHDEVGARLHLAAIHRSWFRHISWCWSADKHALVLAPFGHGKSRLVAVGLPSFLLGRQPTARIKLICNDDDSARERVKAVGRIIKGSPNFAGVFPGCVPAVGESWTEHKLRVQRPPGVADTNPSLHARGIFTTGVGGRADYLIFDDVVDQRNALDHPVVSDFGSTWMSRLEPEGRACAIGTVWHKEDLWHHLMRNSEWVTLLQRIRSDLGAIEQEVWNAPSGYPGLLDIARLERDVKVLAAAQ